LIANISGTAQDIQNWMTLQTMVAFDEKSPAAFDEKSPAAFDEKSPVNFGPLTAWNYT